LVSRNGSSPDLIRVFVALPINEEVRGGLAVIQKRLKQSGARVGWVKPANIHLTLAFLGYVPETQVTDLAAVMDEAASRVPAFRFEVAAIGTFGSPHSPRVVWAGVEDPSGTLSLLHQELVVGLAGLDIPLDDRPFRPHLTLGRVRSRRGVVELTSALGSVKNSRLGGVEAGSLHLMRSRLESQGAQYSLLHASPLTGAERHGG
jgi:2'-5' RNA ligase